MDIHEEVDHILARIEIMRPRARHDTLQQRIRAFLAEVISPEWSNTPILAQALPDGTYLYTASRVCINCGAIHTFVFWPDGDGFQVAAPSPIDCREDGPIA